MMRKDLYLIDFDGTLFASDALWMDFKKVCEKEWNISPEHFDTTYAESKTEVGAYDIDTHIKILGIDASAFRKALEYLVTLNSYTFPDVLPFFEKHKNDELVVLTLGVSWFQKLKISSLPVPKEAYSVQTTLERKSAYIASRIELRDDAIVFDGVHYKSITFIDNMADAFLMGGGEYPTLKQVRIRRNQKFDRFGVIDTPAGIREISTLTEL